MHVSIPQMYVYVFINASSVLFGNTPFNASVFEAAKSLLAKRQLVHEKLVADYLKTGKVYLSRVLLCVRVCCAIVSVYHFEINNQIIPSKKYLNE
jgi:hypothetical protein